MVLKVVAFPNYPEGLRVLGDSAFSIRQDLESRLNHPRLCGKDLWGTQLDSRTVYLYGGTNKDKREVFKIENEFETGQLSKPEALQGPVAINEVIYSSSTGTEFVIIRREELKGAKFNYAIREDKYDAFVQLSKKGKVDIDDLVNAGGFRINIKLHPSEVLTHDGWLELAVGKNQASSREYGQASKLLAKYFDKAQAKECFSERKIGMGFYVDADAGIPHVCPIVLQSAKGMSGAGARVFFIQSYFIAEWSEELEERMGYRLIDYGKMAKDLGAPNFEPSLLASVLTEQGARNLDSVLGSYKKKEKITK